MALRLTWSTRGGWRLSESKRVGRLRLWESIPLGRSKTRRLRRVRRGASYRL